MKRIIFLVSLSISLFIIFGLITSIYSLWRKQDVLVKAQKQLDIERSEHQQLEKQLRIVGTQTFLEQEARDNLFLVKPGEQEVVIAQDLLTKKDIATKSGVIEPNWLQWVRIFF